MNSLPIRSTDWQDDELERDARDYEAAQRLSTSNPGSEQMRIICEICGQFSESERRCTSCGAENISQEDIEKLPARLAWGWAVFVFNACDRTSKEMAINYMRERWKHLEDFTQLSLIDSQLARFFADAMDIKLLVREDFFDSLNKDFSERFGFISGSFQRIGVVTAAEANTLLQKG